jgi:hypothetical protein
MPTKRTRVTRNLQQRVTPAAVEHFRKAMALQDLRNACEARNEQNDSHVWYECGICSVYREHHLALHRELRLHVFECSPLDVDDGESPWPRGSGGASSWPKAQELRKELDRCLQNEP